MAATNKRETVTLEADGARSLEAGGHLARTGLYLRSLRRSTATAERGADVELRLGAEALRVHSAALAAHSRFFERLLAVEEPPVSFQLSELRLSAAALRKAVDFVYTGTVTLAADSLTDTLSAAAQLEMPALHKLLEGYLRRLSLVDGRRADCLNACFTLPVEYETRRFVLYNAARAFERVDLNRLTADALVALLANDSLHVSAEPLVLHAALAWLRTNQGQSAQAERLFDCVRFGVMTTDERMQCARSAGAFSDGLGRALEARLAAADWSKTCLDAYHPSLASIKDEPRRSAAVARKPGVVAAVGASQRKPSGAATDEPPKDRLGRVVLPAALFGQAESTPSNDDTVTDACPLFQYTASRPEVAKRGARNERDVGLSVDADGRVMLDEKPRKQHVTQAVKQEAARRPHVSQSVATEVARLSAYDAFAPRSTETPPIAVHSSPSADDLHARYTRRHLHLPPTLCKSVYVLADLRPTAAF